jgi:gliding motility-associated-like protein
MDTVNKTFEWLMPDSTRRHQQNIIETFTKSGSYFVIGLASTIHGCKAYDTVAVTINPSPELTRVTISDSTVCDSTDFYLSVQNSDDVFTWRYHNQNQQGMQSHFTAFNSTSKPVFDTIYFHAETFYGCASDSIIVIKKLPSVPAIIITDSHELCDLPVQIHLASLGDTTQLVSNIWYINDDLGQPVEFSRDSVAIFSPDKEGIYNFQLVSTNFYGCSDTANTEVRVSDNFQLFMPNAFSPNGDGINDLFLPAGVQNIGGFKMEIYNRWGEKMFETTDPSFGWNGIYRGKLLNDGVYIYVVRAHPAFCNREWIVYQGSVTMIK